MRERAKKLERIRGGAAPRVLDLFAGCGGLSLGFLTSGFEVVGAVEVDPDAAASHARNFVDSEERELHGRPRDITEVSPEDLVYELGLGAPTQAVDVIVGGPPCQAFARVGRAKLREVAAHPEAFQRDERSDLYLRYLHFIEVLEPLVVLFENVPDVLNYGGHNILEEISEVLDEQGYRCAYTLLNSAFYGVPQMRERAFLLAYAEELGDAPTFPDPTHWVDLPDGYKGTRAVALKPLRQSTLFNQDPYYVRRPEPTRDLPPAVTAEDALRDLPPITLHLRGELKRGARRFTELTPYSAGGQEPTQYGRLMRSWPGFENDEGVYDHVIRYLPRDYQIFRVMNPGDQYPEAHKHALRLFEDALQASGTNLHPGSKEYKALKKSIVPPYDPGKFPNKWRKMEPDAPARTLMAHLGKDSYSHIHYDSGQARTISVREAARLQSFPDGFVFSGTMNPAFRQIGNAVPPLLAFMLANSVGQALGAEGRTALVGTHTPATV